MKKILGTRLLSLLLAVVLVCSLLPTAWADELEEAEEPITVQSIELAQTMDMKVGDTKELSAKVILSDGSKVTDSKDLPEGVTITWEVTEYQERARVEKNVDNELVAMVTAEQVPETNAPEKETPITITVSQPKLSPIKATCKVSITSPEAAGVEVSPRTVELAPGSTQKLTAKVKPETAPQEVTWSSKNPAIADVDETGLVKGVSAGRTEIVASSTTKQDACIVTVQGIVLDETEVTIRERDSYNMKYTIFGDQLDKTVEWTSDNPNIVRVDNGYLYGIAEGEATITAKVKNSTYYATCKVTVERNMADVIQASVEAGEPLYFSSIQSKLQSQCSSVLGSSLSYISGLSVDTRQGTLYYRYHSDGDTGAGVGTGERYYVSPSLGQSALSDITFIPKSDFSGTAVIHYTGYDRSQKFFQGTIEVEVAEMEEISYSVAANQVLQLNVNDFNRMSRNMTGRDLNYVMFSQPDSSRGTLYYDYVSEQNYGSKVDPTKQYRRNGSPNLSDVYFVPVNGYDGEVVLSYTGYDVNGDSFRGRVKIRINRVKESGDLNYEISQGGRLTLDDDDFNDLSKAITGYSVDYVQFQLPSSREGTLYYNYTGSGIYDGHVEQRRNYYRSSSPYIRRVTFVAEEEFVGNTKIDFTAWDIKGNQFTGTISISVGRIGSGDIRYSTYQNGKVTFDDDDFDGLSRDLTDSSLRYVRFELPASSEGTLYYNYKDGDYDHKVTDERKYYRNSSPYVDRVTFVPNRGFTGTVSIPFEGESVSGDRFRGVVEIGVDSGSSVISYEIEHSGKVTFDDRDFNDLSKYLTGESLRYIRIDLPSSSKGTLYYDYSNNGYNNKVSSSRSYYRSSSPYIDRITFVADDSFAGTVAMDFTGWSTEGEKFEGTVEVTVKEPKSAPVIQYQSAGGPIHFSDRDFISACDDRGLGSLKSVQFDQPSSSGGTLYYRYDPTVMGGNTEVSRNKNYYPDGEPRLSDITFVPRPGYQGSVTFSYTGTDSRNNTYKGQVQIVVSGGTQNGSRYFTDMKGYEWAISSVDYLFQQGVVSGSSSSTYDPGGNISRGDFMLMLYHALDLPDRSAPSFTDVPANSYYAKAISSARALGIATGYADGGFHPDAPVSRQDAAVFIKRAMEATGWRLNSGNTALLYGYQDGYQVSDYAKDAMATMIEYGIMTGSAGGYLYPQKPMNRAEMAVVLVQVMSL